MRTLYEASNAVEAHMLVDLLKQEGLTAEIHGEYLQGGVGHLPANGLVRLVIDESEYAEARAVVERWDSAQPAEAKQQLSQPPRSRSAIYGLIVGLVIGVGGSYGYFHKPTSFSGFDHNGDGVYDEKWINGPSGLLLRYEMDRNLDGKVDFIGRFDSRGVMASAESDDNFDGVFETRIRYRNSNAETAEVDTDGDGYPDLSMHYLNGVLFATYYMNPSTGLPLRYELFHLGKLTTAEVDTDKDGSLDTRYTYGTLGEVTATEKLK
jgi:hypothetical protein